MHSEQRHIIKQILRARGIKLKQLQNDCKWNTIEIDNQNLVIQENLNKLMSPCKNGNNKHSDHDITINPEETEAMLIDYGRKIQENDITMLDRCINEIHETKQVCLLHILILILVFEIYIFVMR